MHGTKDLKGVSSDVTDRDPSLNLDWAPRVATEQEGAADSDWA